MCVRVSEYNYVCVCACVYACVCVCVCVSVLNGVCDAVMVVTPTSCYLLSLLLLNVFLFDPLLFSFNEQPLKLHLHS